MPWSAEFSRRTFLHAAGLTLAASACPVLLRASRASGLPEWGVVPEYSGTLDEMLVVYDQSAGPHLLREIVEIVRHAPKTRLHFLVSASRLAEAKSRCADFGLEAEFHASDEDGVHGDWGRDILQLGRDDDGVRVVHVPWNKQAVEREDLERGLRQLQILQRDDLRVRQLPLALEGGNLIPDRRERRLVFAGSTIARESRALYRHFYGQDPGDDGVAAILAESLGADEVIWIGPPGGQGSFVFHVDMLMTLVSVGVAVVAQCDPARLDEDEHRAILESEATRTLDALRRREASDSQRTEVGLPEDSAARAEVLAARLQWERHELAVAASEMDAAASTLSALGYKVHRVDADPRRVRRFQSPTNVIPARDRLLVPIYPTVEHVHGWVVHGDRGRDVVDVDLGLQDSEFALEGDNLARVELYRSLHPGVRVVRDYFYMASGNLHCVIARLS